MFTDSHAHLDSTRFDADRAEVFVRAKEAGVTNILAIGNGDGPGTGTLDCAVKLAQKHGGGKKRERNFRCLTRYERLGIGAEKTVGWTEWSIR